MRYLVSTSLIALALVVSAAWTAPVAHAQDGEISNTSAPTAAQGDIVASTPTPPASASGADTPTPFPSNPAGNIGVFATVIQWIMSLFAWLVGVAAITLDTAVLYTVVGMGKYVENLSAIGVAWTVLRDVGNIALIFGFLAVGITVILNVDWYGGGKKLLPMLIIAAVFLNFSLFIAEAVIDVGNLFATQVYTQINGGQPAGTKGFDPGYSLRTTNEGVSDAIMAKLGLASIYNAARENKQVLEAGNSWIIGFMGILLFLVTAFVMFSLAFILIARFVILILLIILSPVGIAGLAIPKLQSSANLWWHTLFEQVFIAPVLLLMLYVALRVILDQNFLTGFGKTSNSAWASFFGGGSVANYGSMLLSFLVAMGLLLAVVLFAKKMSAFGASWATSMGGKLSFGAAAYALSAPTNAFGRAGRWAVQRYAPNSRVSRIATRIAFRPMENARVDVRRVPGVGKGLGAVNAGEAAQPIAKSVSGRITQGVEWWKSSTKAANKRFEAETRIQRFQSAVSAGNTVEATKIMRGLTDDELTSGSILGLIESNPLAVQALSVSQAAKLPDGTIAKPAVYLNMNVAQLEAIRRAGNLSGTTAQTIGLASFTVAGITTPGTLAPAPAPTGTPHAAFAAWFSGRNPQQQDDIRRFWGF